MTVERLGADMLQLVPALSRFSARFRNRQACLFALAGNRSPSASAETAGYHANYIRRRNGCLHSCHCPGSRRSRISDGVGQDALCSTSDEAHDAAIDLYHQRYSFQVEPVERKRSFAHGASETWPISQP